MYVYISIDIYLHLSLSIYLSIYLYGVYCKLQNYIYQLMCTHCGIQYAGQSITPLNLRMNIHWTGKSGCKIYVDH